MASDHDHNVVKSVRALVESIRTLPASDEKTNVINAVENVRSALGAVGYEIGRRRG